MGLAANPVVSAVTNSAVPWVILLALPLVRLPVVVLHHDVADKVPYLGDREAYCTL